VVSGSRDGDDEGSMTTSLTAGASNTLARAITSIARPLHGAPTDFDSLLDLVGAARYVLIGEASHGTHEFYRIRGEITKRLIRERGFTVVAVEADWPDAYRVNRFVRGANIDPDAEESLGGLKRFPQWMWRNADVVDFVGWLRAHNEAVPDAAQRVGFYGLDLYSMHASMAAVLEYLQETERMSHYFGASLPRQFDALLHYDVTRAVEPLEPSGLWEPGEIPETYPSAL
jgi:erythromycin esterase-like protein